MLYEFDILRLNRLEIAYEYCTLVPKSLPLAHLFTVLRWLVFCGQQLQTERVFWKICMRQDSRHCWDCGKCYQNAFWHTHQEGRRYRAEYRRQGTCLQARSCVHHIHVFQIYKRWHMARYVLYTEVELNVFCFLSKLRQLIENLCIKYFFSRLSVFRKFRSFNFKGLLITCRKLVRI